MQTNEATVLKVFKKYCKPCPSAWLHDSEMRCNQRQRDTVGMSGLRRAFAANDREKEVERVMREQ